MVEYFTPKEVAEMFKMTQEGIHNWIKQGKLKAYKINGKVLIEKEDLKNMLQLHPASKKYFSDEKGGDE